ncbi:MAG: hypothetical protein ACLGXA_16860 [Acidobacteriota bacterium]
MKMKWFASSLLVLPLLVAGCSHPQPVYYAPPPPPAVYSQVAQQGYHDGWVAGRHDLRNGFAPDADRHPRFRRPPVGPPLIEDYRHGFRDGYHRAFSTAPPPGY